MQNLDVTLKTLLVRSSGVLWKQLAGAAAAEWLNVELPRVRNPRVDLLARLTDGRFVHLELQSSNDPELGLREAEYYVALLRRMGTHVNQVVLYVGAEPLKMEQPFRTESLTLHYQIWDVRQFDGEPLLAREDLGDNMAAILTGVAKERVFRRVIQRHRNCKAKRWSRRQCSS